MKKHTILIIALLLAVVFTLSACGSESASKTKVEDSENVIPRPDNVDFGTSEVEWRTFKLTDLSGDSFEISDLADDKPVFVETFAVWCSNCKKQQAIVTELHEELGDSIETIAIEIDPNAVPSDVASYVSDNGFKSRYIVAPKDFTQSLVDEFGAQVVSAPSVPMLFICGEEVTLLRRGIKPISELKALVEGCNV